MAYVKTDWVDRVVEKPNTFIVTQNSDGTITLTPAPGQVVERGTPFSANNMNKIEEELENISGRYIPKDVDGTIEGNLEVTKDFHCKTLYTNMLIPKVGSELVVQGSLMPLSHGVYVIGGVSNHFLEAWINNLKTRSVYSDYGHLILGSNHTGSVQVDAELCPKDDGEKFLGVDSNRWRMVYSAGGVVQGSDMRIKSDIRDIDDEIFFEMVKGTGVHSYVLNYKGMPKNISQETAPEEQVHVGIIAQELAQYEGSQYILNYTEKGGYTVNNYNFTSAVMAALKVEIKKREALEKRVGILEDLIKV